MVLNRQIFYIDSHNKLSGSDTDFTYEINLETTEEYTHVTVLDISIPKSEYLINESTNKFTLIENGNETVISLPIGNYSRSSFRYVLEVTLNAQSFLGWTYSITTPNVSKNSDQGKYTFNCLEGNPSFRFDYFVKNRGIHNQMGFERNTTYSFLGNFLISTNVVNFRSNNVYYLLSDVCQNKNDQILQNFISTAADDFNYITFINQDPNFYAKKFNRSSNNVFSFTLTDHEFNTIDLNGINIVFTLMFFKMDSTNELIKNYIKLKTIQEF